MAKKKEYLSFRNWGQKGGRLVVWRKRPMKRQFLNWKDLLPTDIMAGSLNVFKAGSIKEAKKIAKRFPR